MPKEEEIMRNIKSCPNCGVVYDYDICGDYDDRIRDDDHSVEESGVMAVCPTGCYLYKEDIEEENNV